MIILDQLKDIVRGEFKITYKGGEYASFDEVMAEANRLGRVVIESIMCVEGVLTVSAIDSPIVENATDGDWVEQYKKEFGSEPSFF